MKKKATERIANIDAYSHMEYGDKILKSLPVKLQAQIKEGKHR